MALALQSKTAPPKRMPKPIPAPAAPARVQAKLEVGPVGDRFEGRAQACGRHMRLRTGGGR